MARLDQWIGVALASGLLLGCGGGSSGSSAVCTPVALADVVKAGRVEPMQQAQPLLAQASALKRRRLGDAPVPHVLKLPALSSARLATETAEPIRLGVARKIGLVRQVSQTASAAGLSQRLLWQATANGGQVAAISLTSTGAAGLRLGLWVGSIPDGAMVRVYAQSGVSSFDISGAEIQASVDRNLAADGESAAARTYWTPGLEGDEATIEIELPAGLPPASLDVALPRLSHLFELPTADSKAQAKSIGQSGVCEADISCASGFSTESNATAKMSFVASDGQSYVCSGTLVNDRKSSGTPYFLTARHCIGLQSEASTLNTYWFYRSSSCNSGTLSASAKVLTRGATLLYTSTSTDASFMQLNEQPPAGVTYAGWDAAAPTAGLSLVGIHHPSGDLQKISYGTLKGFSACSVLTGSDSFSCSTSTQATGSYISTQWSRGVTESGSSGSGLYKTVAAGNYLIGHLYGGLSSCANPSAADDYGRFDLDYTAALSKWLDNNSSTGTSTQCK